MFNQYQYQPRPAPVYRPPQQLAFLPPPVKPAELIRQNKLPPAHEPLSQSLEKSVGKVRRDEDDFSFLEFFTSAANIIPFMFFWAMTLLFYVSDLDSWRMNYEEKPDDGNLVEQDGVMDDPGVSDKFVPGAPLDGMTPGIWGSYDKENDSEGDNKTIEVDSVLGKIRYSLGSFDTQMVWDWLTGIAYKEVPSSDPKERIRNKFASFKMDRKEAVSLLKKLAITEHSDLWEMIVTPCSSTKQNFTGSEDCLHTRRNLQVLAWRFFSSDTPPPLYPVRPIRIALVNEEDREFMKNQIDPKDPDYTRTRYYLGATGPIEGLSPFLLGTQIE